MRNPRFDRAHREKLPRRRGAVRLRFLAMWALLLLIVALPVASLVAEWFRPPDAERIYAIGEQALAEGDLGTVQVVAEALAGLDGAGPHRSVLEGAVHLRSGRLMEAVAEFHQARQHPRVGALANTLAGEALYRNRQFGDAIRALSTATQLDHTLTDAHRWLASALYDIGATGPALRELRIVSEQDPEDSRPHRLAGLIHKDMESFDLAADQYREALRRNADLAGREDVLVELAECLLKTARYEELEGVIQQAPRSAAMLAIQASSVLAQGDSAGAQRLVEEALELAPDHYEALRLKGDLELVSDDPEGAAKTLRRAAELRPHDFSVHYQLSQVYAQLAETELAKKHLAESTRLRELRVRFTDLHARAADDLESADLRHQLGVVAMQLGRPDLAISWFSAALALDPNHTAVREALSSAAEATPADSAAGTTKLSSE